MKWNAFILLVFLAATGSRTACAQHPGADPEQENLRLRFHFSRLGCEMDSLANPALYQTIYDWLGTPYKYSGDCRDGIDCSGFVKMLYEKVYGLTLAHSSAEIFKEAKPVRKNSLAEGDLVFFKIRKHRISHVGVYLANDKFAHASVTNGVVISDLEEPYYRKYFYKGGRVRE